MSEAKDFRRYADEAMRWARQSNTEKERLAFVNLALTWFRAAAIEEGIVPSHPAMPPQRGAESGTPQLAACP